MDGKQPQPLKGPAAVCLCGALRNALYRCWPPKMFGDLYDRVMRPRGNEWRGFTVSLQLLPASAIRVRLEDHAGSPASSQLRTMAAEIERTLPEEFFRRRRQLGDVTADQHSTPATTTARNDTERLVNAITTGSGLFDSRLLIERPETVQQLSEISGDTVLQAAGWLQGYANEPYARGLYKKSYVARNMAGLMFARLGQYTPAIWCLNYSLGTARPPWKKRLFDKPMKRLLAIFSACHGDVPKYLWGISVAEVGIILADSGQQEALRLFDHATETLRRHADPSAPDVVEYMSLIKRRRAMLDKDQDFEENANEVRCAAEAQLKIGNKRGHGNTLVSLPYIYYGAGKVERALEAIDKHDGDFAHGTLSTQLLAMSALGVLKTENGQSNDGRQLLEHVYQQYVDHDITQPMFRNDHTDVIYQPDRALAFYHGIEKKKALRRADPAAIPAIAFRSFLEAPWKTR